MNILIEIIGWLGAAAVLGAYGLLSFKKIQAESYAYQNLNIAAGLLLTIYSIAKSAFASLFVNFIWMLIGIGAVWGLYKKSKKNA
ncbi:MAG: hypothetical protein K2Q01_05000 [Rickettsiales bacterium]|nr:hypothetical protein [Rickettsiales bacterium]